MNLQGLSLLPTCVEERAKRSFSTKGISHLMGSPDEMQIDGMGGTYPVTSKIAIVRPSEREDADVDFIFAQVSVSESFVDYDAG